MFEEEAEEYADSKCGKDNRKTTGWVLTKDDFQNGAEVGYEQGIGEVLSKLSHRERMKVRLLLLAEGNK